MTPIGTLCFVDSLFKAKPRQEGSDKLAYSCIIGFDKTAMNTQQYQDLRAAVAAAAADKWGGTKAADPAFMRSLRLPFRNASEKEYEGFDKFEVYISPWSPGDKKAPGVVDINGTDITVPGDVWSGQLGRATVRAFAYDNSGNKGVAFMLEHVQIVKADMPRVDGRRSAQKAFEGADAASQLAAMGVSATPAGGAKPSDDMPF
jgi:hypothetical protein